MFIMFIRFNYSAAKFQGTFVLIVLCSTCLFTIWLYKWGADVSIVQLTDILYLDNTFDVRRHNMLNVKYVIVCVCARLCVVDWPVSFKATHARFTYCPDNITMVTNRDSVAVWWRNPRVDDAVSSRPVAVSQSTSPGGTFTTGVTKVLYKTQNSDGVAAYCQFFVIVISLGLFTFLCS